MSSTSHPRPLTVALVGNPNTGKSTLFSALSGVRQQVGNYAGVTVEEKLGQLEHDGRTWTLIDLPGTYSLAPRSPDEAVTVDALLGRSPDLPEPDVALCVVSAVNLERNLYLVSQVFELGRLEQTIAALEKAVRLDPHHARAWFNLGLARNSLGPGDPALEALQQRFVYEQTDFMPAYRRALAQRRERFLK